MTRPALLLVGTVFLGGQAPSSGTTHRVIMKAADYEPKEVTVRVGDTVEWVNQDIVAHTATLKGGWDVNVLPGRSGRTVVRAPGVFSYLCRYHPNMRGQITVQQ